MPSLVGLALRRACKTCKHKVEVLSYKYGNILLIIIRLCCAFTSMYRIRQLSDYDAVRVFRWYFIPRLNSTVIQIQDHWRRPTCKHNALAQRRAGKTHAWPKAANKLGLLD